MTLMARAVRMCLSLGAMAAVGGLLWGCTGDAGPEQPGVTALAPPGTQRDAVDSGGGGGQRGDTRACGRVRADSVRDVGRAAPGTHWRLGRGQRLGC